MRWKVFRSLPLMLLASLAMARAQPAPATDRVAIPANQTTPRGALSVLAAAMDAGDGAKIRAVLQAANAHERQVVNAIVKLQEAQAKFSDAVIEAFGAADARRLVGDKSAAQAQMLNELGAMPEEIKGDVATIGGPEKSAQFHLARVDGKWVVPLSAWLHADTPQQRQEIIDDKLRRAAVFDTMAGAVNADTYKTLDEAAEALQLKLMKAAMDRSNQTTQPATRPAEPGASS